MKEDENDVILSTNVLFGVQSIMKKDNSLTGMYYDYALAAPLMAEGMQKDHMQTLILGNGTGTFATQCERYFDNMQIEGVEIDEKITALAEAYFKLPEDVDVVTYDGRAYLNVVDKKYDVIMVDAYQDITIPFQMSSVEFFTLVKEHLTENGVMVVNMNMRGEEEGNINQYLADTISAVFDEIYIIDVPWTTNRELFASNSGKMTENLSSGIESLSDLELSDMMQRVAVGLEVYQPGDYRMTDDKAPVELLGMKVIDQLIQDEIGYYKEIFDEEGIQGLLEKME